MTRECLVEHKRSGIGLVLISPEKIIIKKSLRLGFLATNIENGGEGSGNVLRLEISCWPSEEGARGQRCENEEGLESGQAPIIGF